ncbi:MAG: NADPH-dependent reductase [Ilumatobacteraceae bacterium]|nr:NADPH-dependent reductase [Ilumatobacteraceae bacterium]
MTETFFARVTVVVGNPKAAGRTTTAAVATATAIQAWAGVADGDIEVIELADLTAELFAWGDPAVAAAKQTVLSSDVLVVASPVYKASFTGLLKAFLDQFGHDELAALVTVPLMIGAGAVHTLAVEQQLRPVLVEIGASCPTRGLFVHENQLDTLDQQLGSWLDVWGTVLIGAATARAQQMRD